jgi:hypothetical protein
MSKKKNTLKDLDDFLKQQAASLVTPTQLSEQIEKTEPEKPLPPPPAPEKESPRVTPQPVAEVVAVKTLSQEKILDDLHALARQEGVPFRKKFYDLIIHAAETNGTSRAEDTMLINTALYLKSGDNWKEVIRTYWKNK